MMEPTKKSVPATTIGVDLGDRWSSLFVLGPGGEESRPAPVRMNKQSIQNYFGWLPEPVHVVLEVGTHSRWVAAELKELGHTVTVANPRQVQLISKAQRKNDKKDAELLARLGRADTKLLSPIEHRGVDAQRDLAALKARDALVATRTRLVNFVRGIVKSFGERLPDCEAYAFAKRARVAMPAVSPPEGGGTTSTGVTGDQGTTR